MAELLRGAPVARSVMEGLVPRVDALRARGVVPRLQIVRVGEREDDLAYERAAVKRCAAAGIETRAIALSSACDQGGLEAAISEAAGSREVHGILLLRPLPAPLDEAAAIALIPAEKDVDCAGPLGLLSTLTGRGEGFAPCTAESVLAILDHYGVVLDGANVTVVGRSLVIGRPVAALLLARNATVTTCHTHTRDLAVVCREADVVVAAAGAVGVVGGDCLRAGQVVVDVGTNWDAAAGRLAGDVDFAAAEPVVRAITPVPGGVGAVTTAILARHVVEAAERTCR